jgi:protein SCO1/2
MKELGDAAAGVQVVFVSFDPARDTLPDLKLYVTHYDPDFIGATGTDAQVATVAAQYGVVYLKEASGSAAGYNFVHSDYIYLIDGRGRLRKLYDSKAPTSEITDDVRLLQAAERPFL